MTSTTNSDIASLIENAVVDACGEGMTHADKAKLRHNLRMNYLQKSLAKTIEPVDTFVLATVDGRTLDTMPDGAPGLDVGDKPRHWSQERAEMLAERWNRDAPAKSGVKLVYWRDHYRDQVERLKADR